MVESFFWENEGRIFRQKVRGLSTNKIYLIIANCRPESCGARRLATKFVSIQASLRNALVACALGRARHILKPAKAPVSLSVFYRGVFLAPAMVGDSVISRTVNNHLHVSRWLPEATFLIARLTKWVWRRFHRPHRESFPSCLPPLHLLGAYGLHHLGQPP